MFWKLRQARSTRLSRRQARTMSATPNSLAGRLVRMTERPSSWVSRAMLSRLRRQAKLPAEISRSQGWAHRVAAGEQAFAGAVWRLDLG